MKACNREVVGRERPTRSRVLVLIALDNRLPAIGKAQAVADMEMLSRDEAVLSDDVERMNACAANSTRFVRHSNSSNTVRSFYVL